MEHDTRSSAFGVYVCGRCGASFERYLCQVRQAGKDPQFCSRACQYKPREAEIHGKVAHVPLAGTDQYAVVDVADLPLVAGYNWQRLKAKNSRLYANAATEHGRVTMHRLLMDFPEGASIDHADNDGLNNRRSNLRIATAGENELNKGKRKQAGLTSKYKGVYKPSSYPKWRVRVANEHGGVFEHEKDAALAYDRLARLRYGEYALTNQQLYPEDF